MMTQIRDPMHLSTNSSGSKVEGLVVVEEAIFAQRSFLSFCSQVQNRQISAKNSSKQQVW